MRAIAVIAVLLAACSGENSGAQTVKVVQPSAETQPPNAKGQTPALPGQTRAPLERKGVAFNVVTVAEGLSHPWGLAFLDDGRMLVTERSGSLRIIDRDGTLSTPLKGLPAVEAGGEGGLMDLAIGPDGLVYWSYSTTGATAVARGRLNGERLTDVQTIWKSSPAAPSRVRHGSRLVFAPGNKLFVTIGDRGAPELVRRPDTTIGKVVIMSLDGSDAKVWSRGHRNIQAAALNPSSGELWTVEHGPRGGDELNLPLEGKDYGWPDVSYGIDYSGKPIGAGITRAEGVEQPIYYWDPVIAPSGMAFYDQALFPAWKGSLFIGGLRGYLTRLTLDGYRVKGEERLLEDLGERIRDVRVGPDGALYLLTDSPRGRILRLEPR